MRSVQEETPRFASREPHMDINYILEREQISLHNALIAQSSPARIAHEGLAAAYGQLLAKCAFPHRLPTDLPLGPDSQQEARTNPIDDQTSHEPRTP